MNKGYNVPFQEQEEDGPCKLPVVIKGRARPKFAASTGAAVHPPPHPPKVLFPLFEENCIDIGFLSPRMRPTKQTVPTAYLQAIMWTPDSHLVTPEFYLEEDMNSYYAALKW